MFYKIKKNIIQKNIDKRNKERPFDYQKAESFQLEKGCSPLINNSYYFSAHAKNISFFCRLGLRSNIIETWFVLLDHGEKYELKEEFFEIDHSPLRIEKEEDKWKISFSGQVLHNKEVQFLSFDGLFISTQRYLDFTSDMPSLCMAKAMAREKWNKSFFAELNNVSGQTHYEQIGLLNAHYSIGEKEHSFSLPCTRDHSFGKRDWNYMNNHLWLMALNEDSQFNYSMVSYPVITLLEVGNLLEEKTMHYLLSSDLDLSKVATGENVKDLRFHVTLENQKTIEINVHVIDTTEYHFQDGDYTLIENIAEYQIDGTFYKGILEVGFNKEKTRFFNSKDIQRIKR